MATTKEILDSALLGIGEADPTNPQDISRVAVLLRFNHLYRYEIGPLLRLSTTYSYDGSDSAHTITAGVGTLPSDFLKMEQVYDGDAPTNNPLKQIFEIEDKVADTDACSQYRLSGISSIYLYGQTPTNAIKLYYFRMPDALTDSNSSSPSDLKPEFHLEGIFEAELRRIMADRNNALDDSMDYESKIRGPGGYLDQIAFAHSPGGMRDNSIQTIKDVWGGF